jgi:bacteriorhodopsin
MDVISIGQFDMVYNAFSFAIAGMGAVTLFLWLERSQVAPEYRTALTISGLVTAIAAYHYFRIFNSWEGAYTVVGETITVTGKAFNHAYRYVDWLLTVPLLLIELILVMGLTRKETYSKSLMFGLAAALMVILGYPGETATDMGTKLFWWTLGMIPFVYLVYQLFVGLSDSIKSQPAGVKHLIVTARWIIVATWCFYPVVYILPSLNMEGSSTMIAVQVGYTIADLLAKAVFGIYIYFIAVRKSEGHKA